MPFVNDDNAPALRPVLLLCVATEKNEPLRTCGSKCYQGDGASEIGLQAFNDNGQVRVHLYVRVGLHDMI